MELDLKPAVSLPLYLFAPICLSVVVNWQEHLFSDAHSLHFVTVSVSEINA